MTFTGEFLALASIFGFLYGYVLYGTPLLPRLAVKTFLQVAGTSSIVFVIARNTPDPSAPLSRMLPVIVWNVSIFVGATLRSFVEVRFSWLNLFSREDEPVSVLPLSEKGDTT